MNWEKVFTQSTLMSCLLRTYLSSRMKKMASGIRFLPQLKHVMDQGFQRTPNKYCASVVSSISSTSRQQNTKGQRTSQLSGLPCFYRSSSSGGWGGDGHRNGRPRFRVKLMDFPERTMPNIMKSFRNRFFSFLIKGYYDNSFSMDGFLEGAAQAAVSVSEKISEGNFADLRGLIVDEAIQEIQNNYADLTHVQRQSLKVVPSDVLWKYIYEIGMMFDDETDQRFVEITIVLYGCHMLENNPSSLADIFNLMENPEKLYLCNYRFIREYTKGVEDTWTINKLNHFLPYEDENFQ